MVEAGEPRGQRIEAVSARECRTETRDPQNVRVAMILREVRADGPRRTDERDAGQLGTTSR